MPKLAWLAATIAALVGCGSSAGGPSGNGSGSFTGHAGSAGAFSCPGTTTAFAMNSRLDVSCTVSGETATELGTSTPAALFLTGYHGSGTYSFVGSTKPSSSLFDMTIGNLLLDSVASSPPEPTSSCTVTVVSPATLAIGDEVTGHIHCTNLAAFPSVTADGGFEQPTHVSFDGDFDGFNTL